MFSSRGEEDVSLLGADSDHNYLLPVSAISLKVTKSSEGTTALCIRVLVDN